MANVKLPPMIWVDVYAATGITVGAVVEVGNLTRNDVRLVASDVTPTPADDHAILVGGRGITAINETGDPGAWALCSGGGTINVREVA